MSSLGCPTSGAHLSGTWAKLYQISPKTLKFMLRQLCALSWGATVAFSAFVSIINIIIELAKQKSRCRTFTKHILAKLLGSLVS